MSIMLYSGDMPLERQVVCNGIRYKMDCTPPLISAISKEDDLSSFIEAVGVWQYSINNYLTIGRIDKKTIVAVEVNGKEKYIMDLLELDTDLIEATIHYLESIGLKGFATSIDDEYYGSKMNLNSEVSIEDLC